MNPNEGTKGGEGENVQGGPKRFLRGKSDIREEMSGFPDVLRGGMQVRREVKILEDVNGAINSVRDAMDSGDLTKASDELVRVGQLVAEADYAHDNSVNRLSRHLRWELIGTGVFLALTLAFYDHASTVEKRQVAFCGQMANGDPLKVTRTSLAEDYLPQDWVGTPVANALGKATLDEVVTFCRDEVGVTVSPAAMASSLEKALADDVQEGKLPQADKDVLNRLWKAAAE